MRAEPIATGASNNPLINSVLAIALAVHRRRRFVEGRLHAGAQALHSGDGGNRDEGGDQTIFDGGGRFVVSNNLANEKHGLAPFLVPPALRATALLF